MPSERDQIARMPDLIRRRAEAMPAKKAFDLNYLGKMCGT